MKVRTNVSAAFVSPVCGHYARRGWFARRQDLMVLILAMLVAFSFVGQTAASDVYGGRAKAKSKAAAAHKGRAATNATFSLDFINTDIIDVLKALSAQSGVNIVATNGVTGKTTLTLHNVTLEEALRLIAASNGLDYAWVNVAYVVGTPEEIRNLKVKELSSRAVALKQIPPKYAQGILNQVVPEVTVSYQEGIPTLILIGTRASLNRAERVLAEVDVPTPPTSKVITLSYAKAAKIAELLEMAVPEAEVQPGPQANSLLVTADGMSMSQVESFIRSVDVAPSAAQSYTAIYTIKYAQSEELKKSLKARFPDLAVLDAPRSYTPLIQQSQINMGGNTGLLSAPQATGGTAGGVSGVAGVTMEAARVERLVLMGAEYTVEKALVLLNDLDVPSRLVKINAIISRINRDKRNQLGIDWSASLGGSSGFTGIDLLENGGSGTPPTRDLGLGGFTRSPLEFAGQLRALESKGFAKILSQPNVLTLDGRQVSFHSGDKIFFQTVIGYGTTGTPILDIREIDVGVTLVVTPQLNPDGYITMTLAPSFATATFRQELGTDLPIVNERASISSVRVKSGESVVIAGLVEQTESVSTTKVPLLGDIPIIGKLFRHDDKQGTNDELIILVTPELIEE